MCMCLDLFGDPFCLMNEFDELPTYVLRIRKILGRKGGGAVMFTVAVMSHSSMYDVCDVSLNNT